MTNGLAAPGRALSPSLRSISLRILASFGAHLPFLVLCVAYGGAYYLAVTTISQARLTSIVNMFATFMVFTGSVLLVSVAVIELDRIARRERSKKPIKDLAKAVSTFFTRYGRLSKGLPILMILPAFMFVFTEVKVLIPLFQPFAWDQTFDHLDRVLHFGKLPWEWLQPVIGYWPITLLLNLNYNLWFLSTWIFLAHFIWVEPTGVHRTRTLLTFMLSWAIIGSLMAVLLSSAGPAFYGRLGLSPDPYAGLMSYLRSVNEVLPIWAVSTQDMLWDGYTGNGLLAGISAMPSMHNASTLLLVLSVWNRPTIFRVTALIHAVLVFIGSIHLAWHYAVDAYLAWAVTLLIWWLAGPLARLWEKTGFAQNYRVIEPAAVTEP
jgi:hypothetical protein